MDEHIAAALSTLITTIATAILMAATYYWGPRGKARRDSRDEESSEEE